MQENNQEWLQKHIEDELTPLSIRIDELDEAIKETSLLVIELKKLVVSFIGGRNV